MLGEEYESLLLSLVAFAHCHFILIVLYHFPLTQLKEHQYIWKYDIESSEYNKNRDLEISPKFGLQETLSHSSAGLHDSQSLVGLPKSATLFFVKDSGWKATGVITNDVKLRSPMPKGLSHRPFSRSRYSLSYL